MFNPEANLKKYEIGRITKIAAVTLTLASKSVLPPHMEEIISKITAPGFNHSGLEEHINELMILAEESLKTRGGITDPQLSKKVRAYLDKWGSL